MQLNFACYEVFCPFDYTKCYMIEHYNICHFFNDCSHEYVGPGFHPTNSISVEFEIR